MNVRLNLQVFFTLFINELMNERIKECKIEPTGFLTSFMNDRMNECMNECKIEPAGFSPFIY